MSNLKKYLKVYKEDTYKANAFKQYMQIVSENQDFFATHEVNEFFTDMIKDGTLVYDEGQISDYFKNAGKNIGKGLVTGIFALSSFLPSALKAFEPQDIILKDKIVATVETKQKISEYLGQKQKNLDKKYEEKKEIQMKIIDKIVQENPNQSDIDADEQAKLNTAFTNMYTAKIEYYDNLLKSIKSKPIANLLVDAEDKQNLLKSIGDLIDSIERDIEGLQKLSDNETDKNKKNDFNDRIKLLNVDKTNLTNIYNDFNKIYMVKN